MSHHTAKVTEALANEPYGCQNNPTLTVAPVIPIDRVVVSAQQVGSMLANSNSETQAAILGWWSDAVVKWRFDQSWAMQSRFIAEEMSDLECAHVASLLDTLLEHLKGIPIERTRRLGALPKETPHAG